VIEKASAAIALNLDPNLSGPFNAIAPAANIR
jgi:hypothetical protein